MKHTHPHSIRIAGAFAVLVLALPSRAQVIKETIETTPGSPPVTETREVTTTTTGTISEFGGERIVVRSETVEEPLTYTYSKATTYVDEAGAPVSIETVKSGLPVTVHYSKVGDRLVANKVVVRKKTTTSTGRSEIAGTSVMGTVTEIAPEAVVIRTKTATSPVRYKFTKTTTYVDEEGKPVSFKTVTSGLPVTVHYQEVGGALVASKVIVRRTTAVPGDIPESTTETKTTTTMGTINEFTPERIVIRTTETSDPVTYSYTKTTTYVDEAGEPVTVDLVKSGLPVTVHYTTKGDARVATKVVVRKKKTTVVPR